MTHGSQREIVVLFVLGKLYSVETSTIAEINGGSVFPAQRFFCLRVLIPLTEDVFYFERQSGTISWYLSSIGIGYT